MWGGRGGGGLGNGGAGSELAAREQLALVVAEFAQAHDILYS